MGLARSGRRSWHLFDRLRREADVVELNFIGAGLCDELGESDVVILNFGVRRVGPDQLAVFAPRLSGFLRLHRQFRMFNYHALVAEDGDAGDGVHVFGVQEVHELRQVVNIDLMLAEQGCSKGMLTLPSESLISKTTALPPTSRQWRMMRSPWSLAAMTPVR